MFKNIEKIIRIGRSITKFSNVLTVDSNAKYFGRVRIVIGSDALVVTRVLLEQLRYVESVVRHDVVLSIRTYRVAIECPMNLRFWEARHMTVELEWRASSIFVGRNLHVDYNLFWNTIKNIRTSNKEIFDGHKLIVIRKAISN